MSSCRFAGVRLYVVANVGFEVDGALSISYEMVPHDVQCNEMVSWPTTPRGVRELSTLHVLLVSGRT